MRGDRYEVHWRHPDYPAWQLDSEHRQLGDALEAAATIAGALELGEVQVVDDRGLVVWPAPVRADA